MRKPIYRRVFNLFGIVLTIVLMQSFSIPENNAAAQLFSPSEPASTANATINDLLQSVSSDNIITHIEKLSEQSRCATAPERTTSIEYIKNILNQSGYSPIIQTFNTSANGLTNTTLHNIIIRKPGTNSHAVHLLTAHFDSSPTRNFPPVCSNFAPGANDNGSGVATLLEIARLLKPYQFRDDIEIVFFDGEEFGHLGSLNFVHNWYSDRNINPGNQSIGYVINLDMVAYPRDGRGQEIVWAVARNDNGLDLAKQGLSLTNQYLPSVDYRLYTIGDLFPPERDPNRLSDQQSFWDNNLGQAIFLTEDVKDIIGADPRYHTPGDKLYNVDGSLRLDPDLAKQTAQVALTVIGTEASPQPRHFLPNLTPIVESIWAKADRPVTVGVETGQISSRGYTWGPQVNHIEVEPYSDATGGQRQVIYFDKVRMELTKVNGSSDTVTNGLLVKEMVSGKLQLGDNKFQARSPSNVPVAGDPNNKNQNPDAPTYSSFTQVAAQSGTSSSLGMAVTATLDKSGAQGKDLSLGKYAVQKKFISETQHNIPDVFWDWFNSQGVIYQANGDYYTKGTVFDWVSTVGLPISEAYWVHTKVGGVEQAVLVQLFERRVLTYTPENPDAFKVEMGNVGQHYYNWRYGN